MLSMIKFHNSYDNEPKLTFELLRDKGILSFHDKYFYIHLTCAQKYYPAKVYHAIIMKT